MPQAKHAIAVLGCGLIGQSWIALFIAHGHDVHAWDPDAAALEALPERIRRPLAHIEQLGVNSAHGALTAHAALQSALADADFIQENAPESAPLKRDLYAQIEACVPDDVIIASSTSALTWSDLAPAMRNPSRFITAHPFNPPHLVPLVELYGIDETVLKTAENLYSSLGSIPVRLQKDAVGHIANRLSSALWREAVNMVAEGIASVEAVDAALVNGPGLRWSAVGSHMAYHLGGGDGGIAHYLSHLGPSQERRWKTLGTPELSGDVCRKLIEGIAEEAAGRSIAELEAERDTRLIALRKALKA